MFARKGGNYVSLDRCWIFNLTLIYFNIAKYLKINFQIFNLIGKTVKIFAVRILFNQKAKTKIEPI